MEGGQSKLKAKRYEGREGSSDCAVGGKQQSELIGLNFSTEVILHGGGWRGGQSPLGA